MQSSRPKVLHPVAGEPLVAHAVRAAAPARPDAVIVVTAPEARGEVEASLGGGVECVDQPLPLGAGNALAIALIALPASVRHVLVVNADVPLVKPETVRELIALHERRRAAITLLSCIVPVGAMQEVGRLRQGARRKPIGVIECAEGPLPRSGDVEVNVGLYAFDAAWLRPAVSRLAPHESGEVENLLEYAEQTAGRIMNPTVFALSEDLTAGEAIHALQGSREVEMVFYLYVVDERRHLVGVVSLRRLLLVAPETPLQRIMTPDLISARVDTDQEAVAQGNLAHPLFGPESVVVGEADAVQPGGLGAFDEFVDAHKAVVGHGVAVGMEVDKQNSSRGAKTGC